MKYNIGDIVYLKGNPNYSQWYEAEILGHHDEYYWVIRRRSSERYNHFQESRSGRYIPDTIEESRIYKELPATVREKMKI